MFEFDFKRVDTWFYYGIAFVVTILSLIFSLRYTIKSMQNAFCRPVMETVVQTSDPDKDGCHGDRQEGTRRVILECMRGDDGEPVPFDDGDSRDPFAFHEHIHGEVKRVQNRVTTRKIEEKMTDEQKKEEVNAKAKQLEAIYNLMSDEEDKFGVNSMDDIQQQMKMYS